MAISIGDVVLFLTGDDSQLSGVLDGAKTKASGWASSLGSTVSTLATGAIVGGVTLAAGAIVGLGAATFSVAGDMQAAQNQIQASLGVTEERAKQLADVAADSFANNWGGSIEEVGTKLAEAEKRMQQFGGVSDEELQTVVEGAYALADVFEAEMSGPGGTIDAAGVLMEKFGVNGQQAMDLITNGMQNIPSDDLLETVTEYGEVIAANGFTAEQFFSIMESGQKAGVLGTDRIIDLTMEYTRMMNEGADGAKAALGDLGLSYDGIAAQVAAGETTWGDQFDTILTGLQGVEDPIERNKLQLAIFGDAAGDLGPTFTDGLTTAGLALEDVAGKTETLNAKYNTWGSLFEGMKRQALVALSPLADKLLEIGNQVMPIVSEAFGSLVEFATPLIEGLADGFGQLVADLSAWFIPFFNDTLLPAFRSISDWLINEGWPAFQAFIQPVLDQVIPGLQQLGAWVMDLATVAWPVLQMAIQFVADNINIILPLLGILGVVILAMSSPISLIVGLIVLLGTAWANNWGGIQEKTQAVIDFIMPYITEGMTFIQETISAALQFIQDWWTQHGDSVMALIQAAWEFIKFVVGAGINSIWITITTILALIQAFWDTWGATIITLTQLAWDNIKTIVQGVTDAIGFIIDAFAALLTGDWEALGEALMGLWRTAWDTIQTLVDNAKEAIMDIVSNLVQLALDKFTEWKDSAVEEITALKTAVEEKITELKDAAIEEVSELKDKFVEKFNEIAGALDLSAIVQVGEDFVEGLWEGIDANWSWFVDKITGVAEQIIDIVKGILGIASPSKVGIWLGQMFPIGLAKGVEEMANEPLEAVSRVARGLVNQVQLGAQLSTLAAAGSSTSYDVDLNYYGPAPGNPDRDLRFVQAGLGATP